MDDHFHMGIEELLSMRKNVEQIKKSNEEKGNTEADQRSWDVV